MLKAKKAIMAIGAAISIATRGVPVLINDAVGACGVGLISYGCWLLLHAAGFIMGGIFLCAASFLRANRRS